MNKVLLRAFAFAALTVFFAIPFNNNALAQCALDTEWTFDPPIPASGSYSAGETIEICGEITFYQSNGANWIHGIEFDLPNGYDLSSINILNAPDACSNGGDWLFYETYDCNGETFGPGFFYDVNSGGPLDGNPCNNWGDPCFGNNANWAFCFEVTLDADCGGGGNPFDGGSIVPGITVYGDGDTAAWGIPTSCGSDDESSADVDVSLDCCDAESGLTPGTILICENGPFTLFGELLDSPNPPGPPLPPEENGFWEYNGGPTGYDWDFEFDPTTDPPGEYTYNVFGTDNCVSSTTITMAFNDLGVVQSEAYCSGAPVGLSSLLDDPLPTPGTWYYPGYPGVEDEVPGGTIDPADGPPAGDYTYVFYDGNNCLTTAVLSLIFSTAGSGGVPTTYEFCSADGQICPLDVLDGNPAGGGSWGLVDANGNPVPPSYPSSDICFTVAELEALLPTPIEDGFAFRYILGAFPCFPPSVVTLTVEYNDPFDSGDFTQTSICVTDPPTDLTTLLDGTPDDGGVWSSTGSGNVVPGGIFDPSTADPGDSFQFIYEGGLNPSLCFNGTILELTIIPADADAGEDNTIEICEDDPSFFMLDSLGGSPQTGGNWFGPAPGNNSFGQFFSPGNNLGGVYSYLISSTCDSDDSELTINVVPVQDPGTDGTLDICENETNIALIDGLGGTPDGGGTWSGGSATVDGNAVNDGDVFTYTVGVAPCERTAEVTINLIPAPSPGTDNTVTVCEGDASFNMVTELGGDAGGTWTGPSPITGDTYTPGTTTPGTYTYTVNPANCPAESAELTVNEVPDADAGNNNTTTVCESVGNINLTSLLGGTPDGTGSWSDSGGGIANPYNVSGQCGTTLTLTYTVDNGTCSDVSTLNLTVECTPDAGPDDVLSFCGDGSTINLDDELPAGISGGTWVPTGTVTLDAANSGNYTYEISPVACNPDEAIYTLNIDPEIAISNVDAQCQPNQTEYVVTLDISGGDGNYSLVSGPSGTIAGGTYTSDPIDLASNPSVSIEIGDGGPCGNQTVNVPAPACSCPATAGFANGNQTICLGESADLILDLDGDGPYTVDYNDGTGTINQSNLNDGDAITVSPVVTTTYTLEGVEDANCVGSAAGTITITVDEPTDAGPDDVVELCGVGGNLALNTLLPAGVDPGTWETPAGNTTNNITLNSGNSGNYTYTTTANACPSDQATYTLTIYDEISTSGLTVSCEANQTEYTIVFDISGGDGNYSFTSTPGAPDITGNIVGDTFTSDPIDVASVPNATITISDGGPCDAVDVDVNAPNCSCPVSGNFDTGNGTICLGESYDIVLDLTGGTDGDYDIEYSDGTNTFTETGLSDQDVINVSPTTTTTYSFSSVSDSNCPGSPNGSVTVTVEDPPNAGDNIELDFCGDGSNLNLISVLDGSADGNGSFNPANIALLPANAGDYVYTEPGNACPDDDATYTINIEEELSFTAVSAACEPNQTEYTVTFTITGGTPPYFVDGNAIGSDEFSETVDFDANPTYEYDITDSGVCDEVTVSGTAPDCNCIAAGSISGSTTICEGSCAIIIFDLVGEAPFNVTYENLNNGVTETLNGISDGHTISVCPVAQTTYSLISVEDNYCVGVVNGGDVVVNVDTQVEVSNITETCDAINENYVVEFTVTGGDGTYNILPQFPVNGSFNAGTGVYTTNPIPSGNGYTITVNDGGECPSVIVENESFDCGCISDAGSLNQTPLEVCDGESLSVTHFGDETLDGNDGFQFVLHDGDANNIGSVIATSPDGTFVFNYGSIVPGQSYFIAAVAGNTTGTGNVDLNHPCASVSEGVEVAVNALPTASISGSSVVCEGEPVNLIVSFTGEGNWDFTFAVNDNEDPDTVTSTSDEYILTVTQPGTYTLTSVSDNNCFGSTAGAVSVQNYDEPTATISGQNDVCEGSNDGPEVELTGNGPWDFVYAIDGEEQPPVTTSFPSNTLPVEESGNYTLVSVNDANCDGVVSGNVNVNLIAQPTATITGGGTVCEGDEAEFNVQLTGTAPWTINYQIDGFNQTPLQTNDPNFSFMGGTEGNYTITTVQDDNCTGVVNTQASLVVNPTPTATYSSSASTFCDGEEIDLALTLEGVPPFHVTYVQNNDTITVTGVQGGIFQTLTPQGTVMAEVLYIEDGSNPTCTAEPDASITIPQVELPNAPELTSDTICSSQESLSIGVSSSPGLSYSWSPESNLSDPTISNPTFSTEIFGIQPQTFTYVLTASNGNCEATDTMTVTVDPGPTARFIQTPQELNIDDPLVRFKNTSIARQGTFFFWEFDTLDTSEEYEPNYTFPEGIEGEYMVTLTAIDPLTGCLDSYMDIISVDPKMLIYVPNAFTPDGDGLNDLWGPVMTNIDEDNYRLTVFNRLGEIVFQTEDPDKKWNGSMNGDGYYLENDVYVWVIETKELDSLDEITRRGRVTLVR